MTATPAPGLGRRAVAALWAAAVMPYLTLVVVVPVARALGVIGLAPVPTIAFVGSVAGVLLVGALPRLATPVPASLDSWLDRDHRKLAVPWMIAGVFAAWALGRMAVFLADPSHVECSVMPSNPFLVHHACLTAYIHGAILSLDPTANVYDMAFVERSADVPSPLPLTAAHFAPFHLDAFGYPPPFLLLPRALLLLTHDFVSQRLVFGAASLGLMMAACGALATTLGGIAERRIWLLTPLFMCHPLVLVTLQIGNFHLATVALCLLCWVALERGLDARAGVLLAMATLAKIFPGLLVVVLLAQRRWRAVGFSALAAIVLCGLSLAVLGTHVWRDFLFYHLPRMQTGEALRFMAAAPREIEANLAPFGIPFKLQALGFTGWGWAQARRIGDVYTLVLVVLAAMAGRRMGGPQHRAAAWLGVVMLASLRSPYAPVYVLVTVVVLLLLLSAEVRTLKHLAVFVATLVPFTVPTPASDPRMLIAVSMLRMVPTCALPLWVMLRKDGGGPAADQDSYRVAQALG